MPLSDPQRIVLSLYNDDCLDILPTLKDKSIDLILTDPPYGTTACKWDSVIPFDPMWKELKRIIKDNGCIALFGSEPFSSHLRLSNLKWYKYDWIWQKNNTSGFALAKKQPMRNHEIISVFYKNQPIYNFIKELRLMNNDSKKRMNYDFSTLKGKNVLQNGIEKKKYIPTNKELSYPKSVKFFKSIPNKCRQHPTQKPVVLLEYLIKTYTNGNDTVLDFTMGSGSTGVACKHLNRDFIGIEMDKNYFEIAERRTGNEVN
jgi:site-specific DNA-methyltransferase (adenine-specific)